MVENTMREITTLGDLKGRLQAGFENNEESLEEFGKTYSTQLKAYLIESNRSVDVAGCPIGKWQGLDSTGWYGNRDKNLSNTLFLDGTRERVWIIYSVLDAAESDLAIKNWVESIVNTVKEAGKTIKDISELYEPAKKIANLVGMALRI